MKRNIKIFFILYFTFISLMSFASSQDYCSTPPFLSVSVSPNVMMILDESGSMQCSSYYPYYFGGYTNGSASCSPDNSDSNHYASNAYIGSNKYYGYFDLNKFYKYDPNAFSSTGESGGFVESSLSDCSNVSGNKICSNNRSISCQADQDCGNDGHCIDVIGGPNCISGNFLNWATMSRIDITRKVLIGGKHTATMGNNYILQGEGGRWSYVDNNIKCKISVGGGSHPTLRHTLNIEDAGGGEFTGVCGHLIVKAKGKQIWGSQDSFYYIYQKLKDEFDVRLRVFSPPDTRQWSKTGLMVRAGLGDRRRHIMISVTNHDWSDTIQFFRRKKDNGGTDYVNSQEGYNLPIWLRIKREDQTFYGYYSYDNTHWTSLGSYTFSGSDEMPNTVYVGIATASYSSNDYGKADIDEFDCIDCVDGYSDDFNDGHFDTNIWSTTNVGDNSNGEPIESCEQNGCAVGTLTNAKIRLSIPKDERRGVVQNVLDKDKDNITDSNAPRLGIEVFAGDRYGCIRDGVKNSSLANIIQHIEDEAPYGSTPTKYALREAQDYFKQRNEYNYCNSNNSQFIGGVGSSKDPWYDTLSNGDVVGVYCRKAYIITISDGEWNTGGDPVKISRTSHVYDLRSDLKGKQTLKHYTLFTFGAGDEGKNSLADMAMYGGFIDLDENDWPYNTSSYPNDSRNKGPLDLAPVCNPSNPSIPGKCAEWDKDKNGSPDTYFEASDGEALERSLTKVFSEILKDASSGSAASVLATNEESGAVVLQALFYPKRYFDQTTSADWVGSLQNLWFYLGPFTQNMREDTNEDDKLNLLDDYVISYFFDNETSKTMVHVYKDTNGDGIPDETLPDKSMADIKFLWEGGRVLWETNPDNRNIFTDADNVTFSKNNFTTDNKAKLKNYLDVANDMDAENLIKYIRGEDIAGYRSRTITVENETHVWKLGDIIYSTPKIISGTPLNSYHKNPPYGYGDNTYKRYVNAESYKNRGMVFVGANDGMLHAFRLGKITMLGNGQDVAKLEKNPETYALGSEAWAFIPKNALPYLKYYKESDYCHLYYVDLTPYVFDASICAPREHENDYASQEKTDTSDTWRTIVIGGMRLGGACGDNVTGAITPPNDTGNVPSGIGRSSYFALDVTDPENPTVLWEFADDNLAFTTTGPSIIHIPTKTIVNGEERDDNRKNGYWYVVFASGPDNYNGESYQPLYLYVLDLKTGELKRKIQLSGSGELLGDIKAFSGRMYESSVDIGTDYEDDGMYFGYTYMDNSTNEWKGGVLRLVTNDDPDVNNWKISKFIEGIGPVTGGVKTLEDHRNNNLWVYFGEGRYFVNQDDISSQRKIYGIKDPCYDSLNQEFDSNCTTTVSLGNLSDATNNNNLDTSNSKGWYISLDAQSGSYGAERMITDPVVSSYGWVFYTTFSPTADICGFGGHSDLWLVNYDNGGTPENVSGSLYIQLSTGAIPKIDLNKEFGKDGDNYKGRSYGRKLGKSMQGAPPTGGLPTIVLPPTPLTEHVVHWREK